MPSSVTKLRNGDVIQILNTLLSLQPNPAWGLLSLLVARIVDAIVPEARRIEKIESAMVLEYSLKDEEGNPVLLGPGRFAIDPKRNKEFEEKHSDLLEGECEIHATRLQMTETELLAKKLGLSPVQGSVLLKFTDAPPLPEDQI